MKIIKATFVTYTKNGQFEYFEDKFIKIDNSGVIVDITDLEPKEKYLDYSKYIMFPSITDLHMHASQYLITGMKYDMPLNEWFENILYPAETEYDNNYEVINRKLMNKLWEFGIFHFIIFGSIGLDSTIDIMNCADESMFNAFVGKMNADINDSGEQRETLEESVHNSIIAINHAKKLSDRVNYAVSPEFVPTCSKELMVSLAQLASKEDLLIQTHFAEGNFDYDIVNKKHPNSTYSSVLLNTGLIRKDKTLLVHGLSSNDSDKKLMKDHNVTLVHCPSALSDNPSDMNMCVKDFINYGIEVGYGSDIGGSGTLNPYFNAISMTRYSNILNSDIDKRLTIWDSLKMMTYTNGSKFGNYGTIEIGKKLSAIIINDINEQNLNPIKDKNRILRFIYDSNTSKIAYRYHNGKEINLPYPELEFNNKQERR